jgi:hypothetical protein
VFRIYSSVIEHGETIIFTNLTYTSVPDLDLDVWDQNRKIDQNKTSLKGQSHEKVYEFLTWDDSFSLN